MTWICLVYFISWKDPVIRIYFLWEYTGSKRSWFNFLLEVILTALLVLVFYFKCAIFSTNIHTVIFFENVDHSCNLQWENKTVINYNTFKQWNWTTRNDENGVYSVNGSGVRVNRVSKILRMAPPAAHQTQPISRNRPPSTKVIPKYYVIAYPFFLTAGIHRQLIGTFWNLPYNNIPLRSGWYLANFKNFQLFFYFFYLVFFFFFL
jgi:hypothetical protein